MQKSSSIGSQIVLPSQSLSAIPIVAPGETQGPGSNGSKTPNKAATKAAIPTTKRLCRNVIIHGFCKFEGKGCEFNHDGQMKPSPQASPENKNRIRVQSPALRNSANVVSSVSADSVNAPVFIPKSATEGSSGAGTPATTHSVPEAAESQEEEEVNEAFEYPPETTPNMQALTQGFSQFNLANNQSMHGPSPSFQPQSPSEMMASMGMMPHGGMDPYYYMNTSLFPRQPLQYHLYTSSLPHVANLHPHQRAIQSFFIPDNLREQLTKRNEATLMTASARELGLPQEVHVYHSLCPLEDKPGKYFGHPSWAYKAICGVDGRTYMLLRIEGFRLVNEQAMTVVESWRRIRHCNVVSIREAFTTRAFGDSSLMFAFDYYPCSGTMYDAHFTPQGQALLAQGQPLGSAGSLVPETTLWSYITQIASALKAIHGSGLAARNIDSTKILITSKNRLRINCPSVLDVLQFDGGQSLARHQQEDLLSFGKLIVALACNSLQSFHNLPKSIEYISRFYSPDMKNVILYLLSKPLPTKTIDEVVTMIGPRILHEINSSLYYNDYLENELSRELENGRLVRLMAKMGFINERPEFDHDSRWSETGDRYIIKLFRDYVFHQVDENGIPVVDIVHVLSCLNKLDAGVDEKIMLMSRDEQSCLVVSYKEIKNCIAAAFNDLSSGRR